jgi:gluconate 5-dehydrogenase
MGSKLEGLRGVITGAAGGLGGGFARAFVEEGAGIELWDLSAPETLASELGGDATARAVDITEPGQVSTAMEEAHDRFGRLDFIVNNAGVRSEVAFLDQGVDDWRRTVDVNLTGTFLCSQAAARIMVEHGGGKIVNISSVSAILAFTTRPAYIASKAAVMGLTRAIAAELGGQGVICNAIAPGIVETPLTAHYFEDAALAAQIREGTPGGRWGQPVDLAGAAVFLCGPDSEFVQGQTLVVDGGWTIAKGY